MTTVRSSAVTRNAKNPETFEVTNGRATIAHPGNGSGDRDAADAWKPLGTETTNGGAS